MRSHRISFTVAMTCISWVIRLRDRIVMWMRPRRLEAGSDTLLSRHSIPSGNNRIDGAFVTPAAEPARALVLLCHGIGEIVDQWIPVQRLLAAQGVASLVFDYSGYGRSTGRIDWSQCELDAVSAFEYLQALAPWNRVSLLGFSLGSGIAAAVSSRVDAERLVLCAAFTSFRDAAHSLGIPARLGRFVPPIWNARESLCDCDLPVLVVHGERDRIFSVQMAAELAAACGPNVELLIVPGVSHNEPFNRPQVSYWGRITSWLLAEPGAFADGG
jgi:alpha-beta hydrolase superfamily lysophospholipase